MPKRLIHERIKKYTCLTEAELMTELGLRPDGYTPAEAEAAGKAYGGKESKVRQSSFVYCLRRAFLNPFALILLFLGLVSVVTDILLRGDGPAKLSFVSIIFSLLLISGGVRLLQELQAKSVADSLSEMVDTGVNVLRAGQWCRLASTELAVGDRVSLAAGSRVPADIRLLQAEDVFVSQAVITGESAILAKNSLPLAAVPVKLNDFTNIIFHGSTVTGGKGEGIVLAVGSDTVYGSIRPESKGRRQGFDAGASAIAWVLLRFMAVLLPVVFLASGFSKANWLEAFIFALSVAVGLTPELLPMVVNACLARGSRLMSRKHTVVKNINAMQGFGSMDVLCVDKTGTLTGDQIILEYYLDILGNESRKALDYAYLASYYHTGVGNHLDAAILRCGTMPGKEAYYNELTAAHPKLDEQPFDHNLRFSGILLKAAKENLLVIKGSVAEVLSKCSRIEYGGKVLAMPDGAEDSVHEVVDEMLEDGMKVIAVAYKNTQDITLEQGEKDFILLGYLAFFDAPKKSAGSAVQKLQQQSVQIKVLTGDQAQVARSICTRLGIEGKEIITGGQLENLSENELPLLAERVNIFAELSPKQKALLVEQLQSNGHTVGFLGDGMNDLPAVLQADVGISVDNATEAVKECAEVILLKKDLNVLEEGIIEGRKAFANMSKYIKITASSNFGNICAVVVASVLLPFFPMTSVQLLLLNLLYDLLCLVLPWDNVDESMLARPLEWSGKRLGSFMLFFGPLSSVFDLITFAFLFFVLCPLVCGGSYGELGETARQSFVALFQTGWFLESMWTQVLILQLLRTHQLPFVQSKPGKPFVVITVAGVVLFTLLPLTACGEMAGLCPLPPVYYLFLLVVVLLYLLLVTLMKRVYLRRNGNLL